MIYAIPFMLLQHANDPQDSGHLLLFLLPKPNMWKHVEKPALHTGAPLPGLRQMCQSITMQIILP